jgi:hypothetical protein
MIIASVPRATAPTKTASGEPSLANFTVDEPAQAEGRARDLLGRFQLYPEIELQGSHACHSEPAGTGFPFP